MSIRNVKLRRDLYTEYQNSALSFVSSLGTIQNADDGPMKWIFVSHGNFSKTISLVEQLLTVFRALKKIVLQS